MDNLTKQLADALRKAQGALDSCAPLRSLQAEALADVDEALAAYDDTRITPSASAVTHTAEPWTARGQAVHAGDTCIRPQMVWGSGADCEASGRVHTANARRIVACVNACARIPTELLERGYLRVAVGEAMDDLNLLASYPNRPNRQDVALNGWNVLNRLMLF